MNILVLNPPTKKGMILSGRWVRQSRANQSWYPIHLSYLTGFLLKHNFNVGLLDACDKDMSEEMTFLYITKILYPEVVFGYWTYDTAEQNLAFYDRLAAHNIRIVLVGPWSLCAPDALLQTKRVNVETFGEFEYTCLELLQNDDLSQIKGIIYRDKEGLHTNPRRPLCSSKELDEMPFVTSVYKQFLDLKLYRQTSLKYPFIDLFGARGCTNFCSYCQWVRAFQGGPFYRSRSIKNIINELWYIKNNLPEVKQIFFQDDTLPQKHVTELSQAILDEKLDICWGGYSRAELSYDTLKLMKESGCRTLHIGYESPIQSNLDIIHKGLRVEQMQEFAANVKKLDMWSSATLMLFPWMTPEEIKFSIDWVKKIRPKRMNFIQAQAYPNTPYADTLKKFGEHPDVMPFDEEPVKLMSFEEMEKWEQWGFKRFYVYNPRFWWEVMRHPGEWRNVYQDAKGLVSFMRG